VRSLYAQVEGGNNNIVLAASGYCKSIIISHKKLRKRTCRGSEYCSDWSNSSKAETDNRVSKPKCRKDIKGCTPPKGKKYSVAYKVAKRRALFLNNELEHYCR
jgi:hypothetical protein